MATNGDGKPFTEEQWKLNRIWEDCGICGKPFGGCCGPKGSECKSCGYVVGPCCMDGGTCFVCKLQEAGAKMPKLAPEQAKGNHFIVIGSSMVGTYFAITMAQRGYKVSVFEKNDGESTWYGAICLSNLGLFLQQKIGMYDTLIATHHQVRESQILESDLKREITYTDLANEGSRYGLPTMMNCNRRLFLDQMRDHARQAGVDIQLGKEVTLCEQDGNGVKITFKDGSTQEGDYLIGADGVHSQVRKTFFAKHGGKEEPHFTGHWCCVGVVTADVERDFPKELHMSQVEVWGKAGVFMTLRWTGTQCFWAYMVKGPKPKRDPSDTHKSFGEKLKTLIRKDFSGFHEICLKIVDWADADQIGAFELPEIAKLTKWADRRVLLMGDSAHAMCNRLGAGAMTGMEDAFVAADLIDLCRQSKGVGDDKAKEAEAIQEAFKLTERRRINRGKKVQDMSNQMAMMTVNWAGVCCVEGCRNALFRAISRPASDAKRVSTLDFLNNYRVDVQQKQPLKKDWEQKQKEALKK